MKIEGDIRAKDVSYWDFLDSSSGMYVIPTLQRPYTWGKTQIINLFNDIKDASGPYYIGSIVIIDREGRSTNRDQIIDGQQRLTTLSLLLVAMRDYVGTKKNFDSFNEEIESMLYRLMMNGEKIPRLSFMNEQSNKIYELILSRHDTQNLSKAQIVFVDAVNQTKKLLKEYSPSCKVRDMENLLSNIKSLQIVLIECKNQSAAFDLFESINATGVTLASNDIIKNRLFQISNEYGKVELASAERMWTKIEENLEFDSSKLKTFIRHQWLSTFGYTSHKKLFKDFEEMIGDGKDKGTKANTYLKRLLSDSDIYKSLLTAKVDSLKGVTNIRFEKEEIRKSLEFLSYLGVDQVYSVLLYLYRTSPKNFKKDINRLVAFQFLYKNVPGSPSTAEKIFADLTENKITKNIMFKKLNDLCEGYEKDFIDNLNKKLKYKEGRSGDVQFLLEKYLISKGAGTGFSEPTIEHIIPKSTKQKDVEDVIHNLGNLTILEKLDNGTLQDKSLNEKLEVYKKVWNVNKKIKNYSFNNNPISAISERGEDISKDLYKLLLSTVSSGKWKI